MFVGEFYVRSGRVIVYVNARYRELSFGAVAFAAFQWYFWVVWGDVAIVGWTVTAGPEVREVDAT